MKNMKKMIIGTVLAAACALSACSISSQAEGENSVSYVTLNEFESQPDLSYMMLRYGLGIASLQSDAAYIKGGEHSVKVWVQPDPFYGYKPDRLPYLFHSTELKREKLNYTDWTDVVSVDLQVYNTEDTTEKVGLQLVYNSLDRTFACGETTWFDVASNAWTQITMQLDENSIPEEHGNRVIGVNFVFERPEQDAEGKTFYIDTFRLGKKA